MVMTGNAPQSTLEANDAQRISVGMRGKLNVMGKRLSAEVLDVTDHGIRVSYPFADWPVEGMRVDLDIPSHDGDIRYRGTVAYEPETAYIAGLTIHDICSCAPDVPKRGHCRIPTDLTVQVKERAHPRSFDAVVLNLSMGGALLRTGLPTAKGHEIAVNLSLPCRPLESVPANVVYSQPDPDEETFHLTGIQFNFESPETAQAISSYIDDRLRSLR
jgi:hypothetical protein